MVKKLLLRFLSSKKKDTSPPTWPLISCSPKTNSFRNSIPTCLNSTYIDSTDSCFTYSSNPTESESVSTSSEPSTTDQVESILHAVKSGRLTFDPGSSSSILENAKKSTQTSDACGFESCAVALELESEDPYKDFVKSMAEMVMANGVKDWERLEEMLGWYLRINPESAHSHIIDAFVDLLLGFACNSDSCNCSSSSSSSSLRFDSDVGKEKDNNCMSCEISELENMGA